MNSTSRKTTFSDATASPSPATSATKQIANGIASHSVSRTLGSSAKFNTSSPTSITAKLTRCAPTTDSGTSCRGNRVFRIRFALSSIDRVADCSDVAKNVHAASPVNRKSG